MLSFEHAAQILKQLGGLDAVLIGGQALNYWATRYASRMPEQDPYTSRDIDYLGSRKDLDFICERFGTKAIFGGTHEPAVGGTQITIADQVYDIEVLKNVFGKTFGDAAVIRKHAVPIELDEDTTIKVMHPVHLLQSRVVNIGGLKREDAHPLRQAHAAVKACCAFLEELAFHVLRQTYHWNERLFSFARSNIHAKSVRSKHGIDAFEAVYKGERLSEEFNQKRYPQMRQQLYGREK